MKKWMLVIFIGMMLITSGCLKKGEEYTLIPGAMIMDKELGEQVAEVYGTPAYGKLFDANMNKRVGFGVKVSYIGKEKNGLCKVLTSSNKTSYVMCKSIIR